LHVLRAFTQRLRDGAEQLSANDKNLSRQISLLFNTLKRVQEQPEKVANLGRFELMIYTPKRDVAHEHRPIVLPLATTIIHAMPYIQSI
jgi:hypothetical protein